MNELLLNNIFKSFYKDYTTTSDRRATILRLSKKLQFLKVEQKRSNSNFNELSYYKDLSVRLSDMYIKARTEDNPKLNIHFDKKRFRLLKTLSYRSCFTESGIPKISHDSLESAQIAAIEHEHKLNSAVVYYPCCFCGGYHLAAK